MSKHYVYIMTSSDHKHLHCGYCKDVKRMIRFYNEMPSTHFLHECYKQNVLVWLEELSTLERSKYRFEQLMSMNRHSRVELIESGNPTWVELVPGVNIEL